MIAQLVSSGWSRSRIRYVGQHGAARCATSRHAKEAPSCRSHRSQSRNSTVGSLRAIDCLESPPETDEYYTSSPDPVARVHMPSALSRGGLGLSAAARPCEARSEGCPDVPSSGSCSDRAEAPPPFDAGSVYDALGLVAATPAQRIPLVCLPRQCSVREHSVG